MTDELTITLNLPYERRAAMRLLVEFNRQPPETLTGLALAVDHRLASRRAWLLATFDVSGGYRACQLPHV